MMPLIKFLSFSAIIFSAVAIPSMAAEPEFQDTLRKSDICIPWRWASTKEIQEYHADFLGWGPGASGAANHVARFKNSGVRHVGASMNLIIMGKPTEEEMQAFLTDPVKKSELAQDYQGNPFRVSWWEDMLWRCPFSAASKAVYAEQLRLIADSGADSLHLDGALATLCAIWDPETGLGCFCDEVALGFNAYLQEKYSAQELQERGVASLRDFNYRVFLQQRYPDVLQYNQAFQRNEIPFGRDYQSYQYRLTANLYRELIGGLRELTGKTLPLGANLNSLRFNMLPPVDGVDYLYCEMKYLESGDYEVMAFKLAEALDKPFCGFMDGNAIKRVREQRMPDIIKRWIGLTYAMGANFGIPSLNGLRYRENELEDIRFEREAYLEYFQLIHDHPELFDGYQPFGQVAVLFSNAQQWQSPILAFNAFSRRMLDSNYQFNYVVAGDDRLVNRLQPQPLNRYQAVIVAGDPKLDEAQQSILDAVESKIIRLPMAASEQDIRKALRHIHPAVDLPENLPVWVLARRNPREDAAPLVVHLINRQLDKEKNVHTPLDRFPVSLDPRFFPNRKIEKATLYLPEEAPIDCPISPDGKTVQIPRLHVWGVLRVN